jgi:hypothetical protein
MSETRGLLLLYTVHGPIRYYWSTDCIGSLNVNVCLRTVVPNDKNSPEIDSLQFAWCDFTNFFNPTFIISVSDDCSPFIFKICQTVAVNHSFFNLIFGGIFAIWPNCTTPRAFEPFSGSQLGFCRPLDLCYLTSFTAIRCCDGVIFHINFAVRLTAPHSLICRHFLDLCYLTRFTAHAVDFI